MTNREKIAHLLRRFGLGASRWELDDYEPLGVEGTLDRLLDWRDVESPDEPHIFEFMWIKDEDAQNGTWRVAPWWCYLMLTTQRPLREKLAIFWHDHFAVNGEEIDGLAMHDYVQLLRTKGQGKFQDLLIAMAKNPAMMAYLDMYLSLRGKPNENFAREVMELFTLGVGNYTEKDIQELSRALTGVGVRPLIWEMEGNMNQKMSKIHDTGLPAYAYFEMPGAHDDSIKTVLGESKRFTFDEALIHLANQPQTARYLSRKLWEYFAYENPSDDLVERIAKVWTRTDGHIEQVLRAIAEQPEFWSEQCVGRRVKSPIDYTVAMCRAMKVGEPLSGIYAGSDPKWDKPAPSECFDAGGGVSYNCFQMGMSPLYPPNVAGWDWGEAWISSQSLIDRRNFTGVYTFRNEPKDGQDNWVPTEAWRYVWGVVRGKEPSNNGELVEAILEAFDVRLSVESKQVMIEHFDKHAGEGFLDNVGWFSWVTSESLKLLAMAPEAHLC